MSHDARPDEPEVSARANTNPDPGERPPRRKRIRARDDPSDPPDATPPTTAKNTPPRRRRQHAAPAPENPAPTPPPAPPPTPAEAEPDLPAFLRERAARRAAPIAAVAPPARAAPRIAAAPVRIMGGATTPPPGETGSGRTADTRAASGAFRPPGETEAAPAAQVAAPPASDGAVEPQAPQAAAPHGRYKIYVMGDRRAKQARYVGRTRNVARRVTQHLNAALNGDLNPRSVWLRELLAVQERPVVQVVAECDSEEEAIETEAHWIRTLRAEGHPLTNAPLPDEPTAERVLDTGGADRAPQMARPRTTYWRWYAVGLGGMAALVLAVVLWAQPGPRRLVITPPAGLARMLPPAMQEPTRAAVTNPPPSDSNASPLENANIAVQLAEQPAGNVAIQPVERAAPAVPPEQTTDSSPPPLESSGSGDYILVQVGDTLESIAQQIGVSADTLAGALGGRRQVYAGETISLPLTAPATSLLPPPAPPTPLPLADTGAPAPPATATGSWQQAGGWSGGGNGSGGGGGGGSAGAFGETVHDEGTDSPTLVAEAQATEVSPAGSAWASDGANTDSGGGGGSSSAFGDDLSAGAGELPVYVAAAQATAVPSPPTPVQQPTRSPTQPPAYSPVGGWSNGDNGGGGGGGGSSGVIP